MEKVDDYFKYIKNINKKALDYDKLYKCPFPIIVAITERAVRIKTYGAKEFTFRQWLKTDRKKPNTLWLRNLADDVKIETANFEMDVPPIMEGVAGKSGKEGSFIYYEGTKYVALASINSPRSKRGSRVLTKFVVWDEFNDSIEHTSKLMVNNFLNLLKSTEGIHDAGEKNDRKIFILGNNRSINHPLFVALGISVIKEEITKIYDENGNPFMLILAPIISEAEKKQIEADNKNDFVFHLAKMTGQAGHIYFNESEWDDMNNVVRYTENGFIPYWMKEGLNSRPFLFKVDGNLCIMLIVPRNNRHEKAGFKNEYHVMSITLLKNEFKKHKVPFPDIWNGTAFVSNVRQQKLGDYIIASQPLDAMAENLGKSKISFENIVSRELFSQFIQKK